MPRIGQNPARWATDVHRPRKITVTTIVYIPVLEGYWEQGLEVLKLSLQSLRSSAREFFDLMVLDNGSCAEVQEYLFDQHHGGNIQYLLFSEKNLGKTGAWNILFTAAPGEIIVYTDSDVYFLQGWLEESLKILDAFPQAGMITANPIAGGDMSNLWTAKTAMKDPSVKVESGIIIPEEYLTAYLKGVGRYPQDINIHQKNRKDVLLSRKDIQAYATASHFQFLTKKSVVLSMFPVETNIPLGDDLQFDKEMAALGFWRLSTKEYLVHHMGNKVPNFIDELPWRDTRVFDESGHKFDDQALKDNRGEKCIQRVLNNKIVRSFLKKINLLSYRLLYG